MEEIIAAATYLYNQTSHVSNDWKSLYKLFHIYVFDMEKVFELRKPQLHHLRTYGYIDKSLNVTPNTVTNFEN